MVVRYIEPGGIAVGPLLHEWDLIGYVFHFRFVYFVFAFQYHVCFVVFRVGVGVESSGLQSVVLHSLQRKRAPGR